MTVITSNAGVAGLLRSWRALRRVSQLELALRVGVSQRHLSFVELGPANPSRALVLRLAAELHLLLRDQNALLLAAGYAPEYPETPLEAQELLPVRHRPTSATDSIPGTSLGPMKEVRILPVKCRSFFLEFRGRATQPG